MNHSQLIMESALSFPQSDVSQLDTLTTLSVDSTQQLALLCHAHGRAHG